MSRVIVITSGKGGVGKSNVCLNTAVELASRNYRTCLFDADLGLANANILLGLNQECTLDDVLLGDQSITDILITTDYGFDIIPGSSGAEKIANLGPPQLEKLVASLGDLPGYDYFLIDTASGISKNVISFCLASDETVIVLTPEATSLTDAYALLKVLSVNNYQGNVRILVNNCSDVELAKKTYARYKKVVEKHLDMAITPAGIILRDPYFELAVSKQVPLMTLYPQSIAAHCIRAFVSNLNKEIGDPGTPVSSFWQRYIDLVQETPLKNGGEAEAKELTGDEITTPAPATTNDQATRVPPPDSTGAEEDQDDGDDDSPPLDQLLYQPDTTDSEETAAPAGITPVTEDESNNQTATPGPATGLRSPLSVLQQLLQQLSNPDNSQAELKKLIQSDPALTYHLLKLAPHHAAKGSNRTINLDEYLDSLPQQQLKSFILNSVTTAAFDGPSDENRLEEFRNRSVRRALLASSLSTAAGYPAPEDGYLCGLLLDIGEFGCGDLTGQEDNHTEAGAKMVAELPVSAMLCDAIRFHHHPVEQVRTGFDLVRIVYTADNHLSADNQQFDTAGYLLGMEEDEFTGVLHNSENRATEVYGVEPGENHNSPAPFEEFRNQVMSYLLLQGMMPSAADIGNNIDCLKRANSVISILYGITDQLNFVIDEQNHCLVVHQIADNGLHEQLTGMSISLDTTSSLLIKSLESGEIQLWAPAEAPPANCLLDMQLDRILGENGILCLPLKAGERKLGVIVCGLGEQTSQHILSRTGQLLQLANQTAGELLLLSNTGNQSAETTTAGPVPISPFELN